MYITCQYFEQRNPDSADRSGGCSGGLIDLAIAEAEAEANLYIGKYLPLPSTPDSLKGIVLDIADYRLTQDDRTDLQFAKYERAIDMLKKIERDGFPEFNQNGSGGSIGEGSGCGSANAFGSAWIDSVDRRWF